MNYQEWSKKRFWGTLFIVFVLGIILAPKNPTEKVITEVEKECDYTAWRQLKEIDDEGFNHCTVGFELASEGFYAISTMEFDKIDDIVARTTANNDKITNTAIRRQEVLRTLGY